MTEHFPPQEAQRLAAVRRYDILDTPPDGAFDRVTRIAARIFAVPNPIVSIVDADRIWFKSHHGLEVDEIPRGPGLCASAILHEDPWRLRMRRPIRGLWRTRWSPGISAPVLCRGSAPNRDGHSLGTLCVIDREPRPVTEEQIEQLRDLAAIVMDELELRLSAKRTIGELTLFKEVHHRVKNNLQIVASLLALQSRSSPEEVRK